jgi:hypothetical protein
MRTNRTIAGWLTLLALFTFNLQHSTAVAQGVVVYPVATNGAVTQYGGGLATDGTNYLFVFSSGNTNCAQLVSSNGALLGSQIVLSGGAEGLPPQLQVTSGKTNYLAVWSDGTINTGADIFGQFISRSGATVGSKFPLLQSVGSHGFQGIEALACDGTNFLVIWQDEAGLKTSGGSSTNVSYGQLVTPSGTLSGSEFPVATVGLPLQAQGLGVAFGRTNYLAVWQSGYSYDSGNGGGHYTAYGAFISPIGVVGAPFAISQTNSPDNNDLATEMFDGTNYLAIWNFNPGTPDVNPIDWRVHGRLVSSQGNFPGNETVLVNESNAAVCSLAFDGSDYLAGWGYHLDTTNADKNVHFRFFDRNASPVGLVFSIFPAQGTNAPLAAGIFNGIVFDGKRFAILGDLGTVVIGANGDFEGIPSAQVYGAFLPASTAPPQFCAGPSYGNQQFTLSLAGTPGINYAVQVATNLVAPIWTSLVTNSPTNGPFTFTDTGATNRSGFYQAVKL